MSRRLIDISVALKAGIKSDPPHTLPEIEYLDHQQTAPAMAAYMGVSVDQLPNGEYAAVERVKISTHNGTHLDAPYHFFSTMNHALKPGDQPESEHSCHHDHTDDDDEDNDLDTSTVSPPEAGEHRVRRHYCRNDNNDLPANEG